MLKILQLCIQFQNKNWKKKFPFVEGGYVAYGFYTFDPTNQYLSVKCLLNTLLEIFAFNVVIMALSKPKFCKTFCYFSAASAQCSCMRKCSFLTDLFSSYNTAPKTYK